MSKNKVRTAAEVRAFTDDLMTEDKYSIEEIIRTYDEWAEVYDQEIVLEGLDYTGPQWFADHVSRLLSDQKDAKILELGAGTGMAGERLKHFGFTNIDALDGSSKMLEVAAAKKAYNKIYHVALGRSPLDIEDCVYDAVITIAAFGPNHIPPSAFSDMVRITKPGGYCVIGIWEVSMGRFGPEMDRLISEGKWSLKEKITDHTIYGQDEVHIFILQKSK